MIQKEDCGSKIIKLLTRTQKPIDVVFLVEKLKVNKTTIYRQLEKLLNDKVVSEVDFGDGKKRYELKSLEHHHHLICKKCGKLDDISLDEKDILDEIKSKSKFLVESHSLEFFGYCVNCR